MAPQCSIPALSALHSEVVLPLLRNSFVCVWVCV